MLSDGGRLRHEAGDLHHHPRGNTTASSSVKWSTADGSAIAGSDYVAVPPTTVTFGPGEKTKTVSVTVNGDTAVEPDYGFTVNPSAPDGAVVVDGRGGGAHTE